MAFTILGSIALNWNIAIIPINFDNFLHSLYN